MIEPPKYAQEVNLLSLKINLTVMKLKNSDQIKSISSVVGYRDTAYFCRRFKLMFGVQAGKMKKRINEF